jgi:tRNA threonylcarbamoyladenosine biosynthesis protein TsaB
MRVIAFDTATTATAAALRDEQAGIELSLRDDPPPGARPRHASQLMAQIVELLRRTNTSWSQIDRIAVGVGPGTFTGLRIGVSTARALATARQIELSAISSLQSVALKAATEAACVLAAIDARRHEAFVAAWTTAGNRLSEQLIQPLAAGPDELAALLRTLPQHPVAAGSGALEFRAVLERAGAFVPGSDSELHRVDALCHCRLALVAPVRAPKEIVPEYLRLADAELARRRNAAAK